MRVGLTFGDAPLPDAARLVTIIGMEELLDRIQRAEVELVRLVAEELVVARRDPVLAGDEIAFPMPLLARERRPFLSALCVREPLRLFPQALGLLLEPRGGLDFGRDVPAHPERTCRLALRVEIDARIRLDVTYRAVRHQQPVAERDGRLAALDCLERCALTELHVLRMHPLEEVRARLAGVVAIGGLSRQAIVVPRDRIGLPVELPDVDARGLGRDAEPLEQRALSLRLLAQPFRRLHFPRDVTADSEHAREPARRVVLQTGVQLEVPDRTIGLRNPDRTLQRLGALRDRGLEELLQRGEIFGIRRARIRSIVRPAEVPFCIDVPEGEIGCLHCESQPFVQPGSIRAPFGHSGLVSRSHRGNPPVEKGITCGGRTCRGTS